MGAFHYVKVSGNLMVANTTGTTWQAWMTVGCEAKTTGLTGGLRMAEKLSEHAGTGHIFQKLLRGLARRHRDNCHTDDHMTNQTHCN